MSDRAQLYNDAEEAQRLVLDGRQATIWTAIPGIVQSVNFSAMTVEVQPSIQGTIENENGTIQSVNLPLLVDVPIVFPSAGGFTITFPIVAGDEVLVVFGATCAQGSARLPPYASIAKRATLDTGRSRGSHE